jgi:hypothetical protein
MDDDLVLVPKEDAKLLMGLHRISEKGKPFSIRPCYSLVQRGRGLEDSAIL